MPTDARPAAVEPRILVVGDSHSKFWSGQNTVNAKGSIFRGVDIEWVGALMASGLPSKRSPVHEAIDKALAAQPGAHRLIVTCFGEVDMRVHVVDFALTRGGSLDEAVEDVADSYLKFVDALVEKHGLPVAIWGPPPSRPSEMRGYIPAFPVTGAPLERNYATAKLTEALERRCRERPKVEFFGLFDRLIGIDKRTLANVLYDSTHLSNRNLPAAVEALCGALDRLQLGELRRCLAVDWPVAPRPSLVNVVSPHWRSGVDARTARLWVRADLASAYFVAEVHIRAPHAVESAGRLLSVRYGEDDTAEELYDAAAQREAAQARDRNATIVLKPKRRAAQRFVTFAFDHAGAGGETVAPARASLMTRLRRFLSRAAPPPAATVRDAAPEALQAAMARNIRVMAPTFARSLA